MAKVWFLYPNWKFCLYYNDSNELNELQWISIKLHVLKEQSKKKHSNKNKLKILNYHNLKQKNLPICQ